ncbi:MAG TPA: sortase [Anaerolineales bacterium]|jgi:sortase A
MARDKRSADDLSIEELEALLARKRREARQARVRRFQQTGRALPVAPEPPGETPATEAELPAGFEPVDQVEEAADRSQGHRWLNRSLLIIEVAAVLALAFVLLSSLDVLRSLNQEVAEALGVPTGQPTPVITAVVLPSGHTPPTSPGGAQPNDAEIPENLRPFVQSVGVIDLPTPGPGHARSMHIPAIWNAPAPVVQGDGWEQLKRGVGQHLGSGLPGQAGNVVLSAHNDIFGELFRDLDQLQPGDTVVVSTSTTDYTYLITGMRIVDPTEVSVMEPTDHASLTLISCYPYLVDNKRIVVFAELADA